MSLRLLVVLASLAALSVPASARGESSSNPPLFGRPPESIRLGNGLKVLLAPDPKARLTSIVVSYAAGFADDPNGRRGLAHVTEHLVAERTKHAPSALGVLDAVGASGFNAATSLDCTTYYESFPPERLESILWLESERMGFAAGAVTDEAVRAERGTIRNEDRDRTLDRALAAVSAISAEELFPSWHPYAATGEAVDLYDIEARDVRAFLRTWYTPENATLALAGRFDRDAAVAFVKRYFESLPTAPPPERPRLDEWSPPSVVLAVNAAIPVDAVLLEWRTPAYGERDDAALDLAAGALTGAGNERFERLLVATRLATVVSAQEVSAKRTSVFHVSAVAAPGVKLGTLIDAIQYVLDEFARRPTPGEISRARDLLRRQNLLRLETPSGRASALIGLDQIGVDPGPGFDWGLSRYDELNDADVARAVGRWLGPEHRVAFAEFASRYALGRGALVKRQELGP